MLATLGEIRNSRITQVAQACSDHADFRSLINEATERLLSRGDWCGTIVPIQTCVRFGCIAWPRYVGAIRRINQCGQHIQTSGLWFDYVGPDQYCSWFNSWNWGRFNMNRNLVSLGNAPTYSDIPSDLDCLIRAYPLTQSDVGKTLTIFGIDNNGQALRTRHSDGTWTDGVVITLALPFASTSVYVRSISRVLKDTTQQNVPVYAYSPLNDTLFDIANYEPSETNPSYVKDRLNGCTGGNCSVKSVVALVKLKFIPAVVDTDLVLIDNIAALKLAVQAIKLEEAGQDEAAEIKWLKAVHELNLQMSNQYPPDTIAVDSGFSPIEIGFQKMI